MTSKKTTRSTTTTVDVDIAEAALTSEEERVLRMRRGASVPDGGTLELKPTTSERARQALLAIEREMVFKLQAQEKKRVDRKNKIVNSLRSKTKK
jgi:hypothetical protein